MNSKVAECKELLKTALAGLLEQFPEGIDCACIRPYLAEHYGKNYIPLHISLALKSLEHDDRVLYSEPRSGAALLYKPVSQTESERRHLMAGIDDSGLKGGGGGNNKLAIPNNAGGEEGQGGGSAEGESTVASATDDPADPITPEIDPKDRHIATLESQLAIANTTISDLRSEFNQLMPIADHKRLLNETENQQKEAVQKLMEQRQTLAGELAGHKKALVEAIQISDAEFNGLNAYLDVVMARLATPPVKPVAAVGSEIEAIIANEPVPAGSMSAGQGSSRKWFIQAIMAVAVVALIVTGGVIAFNSFSGVSPDIKALLEESTIPETEEAGE